MELCATEAASICGVYHSGSVQIRWSMSVESHSCLRGGDCSWDSWCGIISFFERNSVFVRDDAEREYRNCHVWLSCRWFGWTCSTMPAWPWSTLRSVATGRSWSGLPPRSLSSFWRLCRSTVSSQLYSDFIGFFYCSNLYRMFLFVARISILWPVWPRIQSLQTATLCDRGLSTFLYLCCVWHSFLAVIVFSFLFLRVHRWVRNRRWPSWLQDRGPPDWPPQQGNFNFWLVQLVIEASTFCLKFRASCNCKKKLRTSLSICCSFLFGFLV